MTVTVGSAQTGKQSCTSLRRCLPGTTGPCLSMLLRCWGREVAALCAHVSTHQVGCSWFVHGLYMGKA